MGLGLTNFALEGGVSGRTSLKIVGKGNSEMTLLSAYITLKMQLVTPASHLTLKKNKHASVHCPARLHLLSPFPLPRSPAYSIRVPPASRRHWSHLAWSLMMLCPARLHALQKKYTSVMIRVCHSRSLFLSCMYIHDKFMTE